MVRETIVHMAITFPSISSYIVIRHARFFVHIMMMANHRRTILATGLHSRSLKCRTLGFDGERAAMSDQVKEMQTENDLLSLAGSGDII